jgi:hypothetical protein
MLSVEFDSLSSAMKAVVYSPAANFDNKRPAKAVRYTTTRASALGRTLPSTDVRFLV